MSRVIIFARQYPSYHIRAGQPTFFVEKIIKSFHQIGHPIEDIDELAIDGINGLDEGMYNICAPKWHTIRKNKRWQAGMKFSPRVWSGKPYASKQIIIAPDIEIKKVYDFEIEIDKDHVCVLINSRPFYEENSKLFAQYSALETLALNDGLTVEDFKEWFKWPIPFSGQVLCWGDINY